MPTYRVEGSFWDTEIWSDAFISRLRSISIPVLPKRTARISSLQACNCTHRSGERRGGTGHWGRNPVHRKVCYVPSFSRKHQICLLCDILSAQFQPQECQWKVRRIWWCYVLHFKNKYKRSDKKRLTLATVLTDACWGFCDNTAWGSSLRLSFIYLQWLCSKLLWDPTVSPKKRYILFRSWNVVFCSCVSEIEEIKLRAAYK